MEERSSWRDSRAAERTSGETGMKCRMSGWVREKEGRLRERAS